MAMFRNNIRGNTGIPFPGGPTKFPSGNTGLASLLVNRVQAAQRPPVTIEAKPLSVTTGPAQPVQTATPTVTPTATPNTLRRQALQQRLLQNQQNFGFGRGMMGPGRGWGGWQGTGPATGHPGMLNLAQMLQGLHQRGDSVLAHISPEEARFMARRFGGDINPHTGLPQFGLFKKIKKVGKKIVGGVKKGVKAVGNVAGDIADATKNIPGVNAFTSQLALLDDPGKFVDIWKNNIAPQWATGAALMGGNYLMSGMGMSPTGTYSGAAIPSGGFQIGNTIYDSAGNIFAEAGGAGGGGLTLGGLLGGGSSAAAPGSAFSKFMSTFGPSILNVGGNLLGGAMGADAAKEAAKIQAAASKDANALLKYQFDTTRADMLPYRAAGTLGLGMLTDKLGPGGQWDGGFDPSKFTTDPGYEFRMREGLKAIERSGSARGGVLSGGNLKALERFAQGTASDEYQRVYDRYWNDRSNQFNQWASLAGIGQTAANNTAQLGAQTAGQMANNVVGAGDARASGRVGAANAWGGALANAGNAIQDQYNLNRMFG